jgi:hypothetical protein
VVVHERTASRPDRKSYFTRIRKALIIRCPKEATMPRVRKMDRAEIALAEQRPQSSRARVAQEYDAYLADFAPGDHGRAELAVGEVRLRVRSRLQAAARRRGLALRFRRGPHKALIFHVEVAPPAKAKPVPPLAAGAA